MIVILGDSHCGTLGGALRYEQDAAIIALKERFERIVVRVILPGYRFKEDFFSVIDGAINVKMGASERIAIATGTDGWFRRGDGHTYGFSLGFHTSIMLRQKYWQDFTILPTVHGKDLISQAAFRAMVLEENKYALGFAQALKALGIRSFFIVAPPVRQTMINRQAAFASSEELVAIHQTYQDIMVKAFRKIGVPLVLPPANCSVDGILKPKYDNIATNDVHHANGAYGRLQWRAIARHRAICMEVNRGHDNPSTDLANSSGVTRLCPRPRRRA